MKQPFASLTNNRSVITHKYNKDEEFFGFNSPSESINSPMLTSNNLFDIVHKDSDESSEDEIRQMTSRGMNSRANSQCFQGAMMDINDENEVSSSTSDDEDLIVYTGGFLLGKDDEPIHDTSQTNPAAKICSE